MKKPELLGTGWLGPRSEMDRASHRFGKCSECHEIVCVEKAVADGPSTHRETSKMLDEAFRAHVKLGHSNQDQRLTADALITKKNIQPFSFAIRNRALSASVTMGGNDYAEN